VSMSVHLILMSSLCDHNELRPMTPAHATQREEQPGRPFIGLSLVGKDILLHCNAIVNSIAFLGRDEK